MGLTLSRNVAPEKPLETLAAACRDRGLDGIELSIGEADDLGALAKEVAAAGLRVQALRVESWNEERAEAIAKFAAAFSAPVSTPAETVEDLEAAAAVFKTHGAKLLLAQGTDLDGMITTVDRFRHLAMPSLGIAWEVKPSTEDLEEAGAVLFACRAFLGLVRLYGGGPEQREQDGSGVGGVLADLALSAFDGPIVLHPSADDKRPLWAEWMASRKIVGCGSKTVEERLELDMREVEPRDRLDTILGAYRSLSRGATMQLTLDHDPSCMNYTLEATEAEGSFSFQTLEHGPEVWKAAVTKL